MQHCKGKVQNMGQEIFFQTDAERTAELQMKNGIWKIRGIRQAEAEEIRKSTAGSMAAYEALFLARSVTDPNLKSQAVQKAAGAVGEVQTMERLLLAGEYEKLRQAVEEINA